jgi:hypothetical protein
MKPPVAVVRNCACCAAYSVPQYTGVILTGPGCMLPAAAIVMFPSVVAVGVVFAAPPPAVPKGDAADVAAPAPVPFENCAGAVADDAPPEDEAGAVADAGASDDRDEPVPDSAEADKDWLAEQPATARTARTAQAVATLTVSRRVTTPTGAHRYRADAGTKAAHVRLTRGAPYSFLATPQ